VWSLSRKFRFWPATLTLTDAQVHTVDQHLIFTSGICKAIVGGEEKEVKAGDMVIVPQGTKHNCEWDVDVAVVMGPGRRLQWPANATRLPVLTCSHQHWPNPPLPIHSLRSSRAQRDFRSQDQGGR
jgi:hypothetical protein